MTDRIDSIAALEAVVGKAPPAIQLKVIDHLDPTALHWLSTSPLMFAGFGDEAGISITLGGGAPGFARGDAHMLRLPLSMLDDPGQARAGGAFGSLFLAPGIGETLRINGRVESVRDGEARIVVEECYVHCAKALIRSEFWSAQPAGAGTDDPASFVAETRFVALATIDARGDADLSPKGDPAGSMARLDDGALWFADRPGNKKTDSFRNIIGRPQVAMALLVPGMRRLAIAHGAASLSTAETERRRFAVRDKTPALVVKIEDLGLELRESAALARADLWPLRAVAEGIDPAKMFVSHVKLNRNRGVGAKLAGAVMSIPGLMQKGLDHDYKSNLY